MLKARECVIWTNHETKQVEVTGVGFRRRGREVEGFWCDPIGAHYAQWKEMSDDQRVQLMVETAIDLAMQGYDLGAVLREFFKVDAFKALGRASMPMCRALTTALLGKSLEPNTMSFDELLVAYAPGGHSHATA